MVADATSQNKAVLYKVGSRLPSPVRVSVSNLPLHVRRAVKSFMKPDPCGFMLQWLLAYTSVVGAVWFATVMNSVWVTFGAVLFIATRQNVLALLMHEQTHWLGFRSRAGDLFCELFIAYPLLVTLEGYRRVHLAHHGNYLTDADPDYIRKQGREWTFPQDRVYFILMLLRDITGLNVWRTLKGKTGDPGTTVAKAKFTPPRWLRPAFLLFLVTVLTLTHTWTVYLVYWVLPLMTVMQGIIRVGAITEHRYNLVNPSVEESTPLIELSWWEKLVLPNLHFTLHIYHHWFPTIPASRLPAVHRLFRESGLLVEENVFRGYLAWFRYILRESRESETAVPANYHG